MDSRCIASMCNGTFKRLSDLQIGDVVMGGENGTSIVKVIEIVETKISWGTQLAYISKSSFFPSSSDMQSQFVAVMSWHPIKELGRYSEWNFPISSPLPKIIAPSGAFLDYGFDSVVSVAVCGVHDKSEHGILVNNKIICATLAHNVQDHPVLSNLFWGTNAVIDSIRSMRSRALDRGMKKPVINEGPFSWKYSTASSECIGIQETLPKCPPTPARVRTSSIPFRSFKDFDYEKNSDNDLGVLGTSPLSCEFFLYSK